MKKDVFFYLVFGLILLSVMTNNLNSPNENQISQPNTAESDPPLIISSPPSQQDFIIGSDINLEWSVTDENPGIYQLSINGFSIINASWISNVPVTYSLTSYEIGSYEIEIRFYDINYFESLDIIHVNIFPIGGDITPPIISSPADIIYSYQSTGHSLSWSATDLFSDTYNIIKDDIEIATGTWNSQTPIMLNIDGLEIGTYEYTISVRDYSGNMISDSVIVEVVQYLLGDVNHDHSINIVDALMVAQYYVGGNPSNFDITLADVSGDGSITIIDALMIAQYYVGTISEFPASP